MSLSLEHMPDDSPSMFQRVLQPIKAAWQYVPTPVRSFLAARPWTSGITVAVLLLIVFAYLGLTREPEPEYLTSMVERGDIVQTVEAVGEIISERDLKLQFPTSGVVAEVLVEEGDIVEEGQKLASLRALDLAARVQSASASLQQAQAELRELQEGTRPEDILISEAEVANARAQLDAARNTLASSEQQLAALEDEAKISLIGEIATARSVMSQQITNVRTALSAFDDVMNDTGILSGLNYYYSDQEVAMRSQRRSLGNKVANVASATSSLDTYQGVREGLELTRTLMNETASLFLILFDAVQNLPSTNGFTRAEREARREDLSKEQEDLQTNINNIDRALKSLQDAYANFETRIAAEKSTITRAKGDILNFETIVRTQEAQLTLKKAGARDTEIEAKQARVRQASAELQSARADFSDTILYAPVAGSITKVNIKTGELLSTAFQQDAAITMLGESPYRIEMYVSEVDIPKVVLSQSGAVELDAFPDRFFPLRVAEIDPAATDVDGVPKYRVKLDFVETDPGFKIGMTGDVDIFTGYRSDVVLVSARAVIEGESGGDVVRILLEDGTIEQLPVETGLEGDTNIEILSGVDVGETVVEVIK